MFETMRKIFGPIAVSIIIGSIALVFVFYGVFNPRGTRGMNPGATAATVNGDRITMQEYGREYQQRVEMFQNMMKGKVDPDMFKRLGIGRQIIEDLVRRKLMTQEAQRLGLRISDEELRDKIRELPYFKKDGKFDQAQYQQLLEANRMTPSDFEESVREDLLRGALTDFIRARVKVSEPEVEKEFLLSEDRRQIDYLFVTYETGKKQFAVAEKEIDDFLKTETGAKAAKLYYDQHKSEFGKKDFEATKRQTAAEVLKDRHGSEIAKINRALAEEALAKAKASWADLASFGKKKDLSIKASEKFNHLSNNVPGIGDLPELVNDAFNPNAELAKGPKLYEHHGSFVIAGNLKTFKPDLANFAKEKEKVKADLVARKEQQLYESWVGGLRSKAKVSINDAITKPEMDEAPAVAAED